MSDSALLATLPEDLSAPFPAADIFMAVSIGDVVFVCEESDRPEIEVRIEQIGRIMLAVPTGRQQPCTVDRSSQCACTADCACATADCPCGIGFWSPERPLRSCDAAPTDACDCKTQGGLTEG